MSSENTPGRAVAAVEAEIAALGAHGRRGLAAAAIAMPAILDDPRHVPTHPTAAAQLAAILDTLHGHRVRPDDIGQPRLARQGYERHAIRECCGPLLEDGLPE